MHLILLSRLVEVQNMIGKLNKKALKRGLELFTITLGEVIRKTIELSDGRKVEFDFIEVDIQGQLPALPGYKLLGIKKIVDHLPLYLGNLPAKYRNSDMCFCDHCNTKRQRNFIAVVSKEGEGEQVIGSTCFKHVFGQTFADDLIRYGNWFQIINDELGADDNDKWFGRSPSVFSTERFLQIVCQIADKIGFISMQMGEETLVLPTAHEARESYGTSQIDESSKDKAKAIMSYFEAMDDKSCSNYEANVKTCLAEKFITGRHVALTASAYAAYERHLTKLEKAKQEALEPSEYIGEVKKRMELDLVLVFKAAFQTMYGWQTVYVFNVNGKDSVVWKTSTGLNGYFEKTEVCPEDGPYTYKESWAAEIGDTVKVKATVKSHELYRPRAQPERGDIKTTYVTRLKPISVTRDTNSFALL